MKRRPLTTVLLVAGIVVLDQITKAIVERTMLDQSIIVIESFFRLTYVRNTGAAFGLLAQTPEWFRQPFFFIATAMAVIALVLFLKHLKEADRLARVAVAAILGGALGNLIDRIHYGYVIDFLDFYWRGHHWPAFNVADACITLGGIGLLWSSLRENRARNGR
jgi:signal peptidase II